MADGKGFEAAEQVGRAAPSPPQVVGGDGECQAGLAAQERADRDLPVTVIGDPLRLHQVLANLLSNARVHTPDGTTVTVTVQRLPAEVEVSVKDDGPGIPAGLSEAIFERFSRADPGRSRATGGAGLGLAIARAVMAAHGGSVDVRSRPGRTEFRLLLPVR
ncbi:ATP-binding protein [Nonomuraea sp. NPDC000554]|uniref:sensor histidine kinase n=1 Tax=Nonomuraea sp. NPDC000554 TaxID=3154259 RepID=UPI003321B172